MGGAEWDRTKRLNIGGGKSLNIFWFLYLGSVWILLRCIGMETALFTEGTNPILGNSRMLSFLIVEYCSSQGFEVDLKMMRQRN